MSEAERILGVAMRITKRTSKRRAVTDQCICVVQLPAPNRHHHLNQARWTHIDHRFYKLVTDHQGDHRIPTFEYHDTYVEQQGFYTAQREFLSREEAMLLAQANGQFLRYSGAPGADELFSEDMW